MGDTIAAISTAQGRGGVAVIRVSGEGALSIARTMFSRRGEYEPNVLYPGRIDCGDFTDYGMCVWFRAPHSFTGEDTVEFHCHGGREIARGVLARALSLGARPAEAGEFTRRAFVSGKLSLSAAEGLGEMISAESAAQVRAGYSLYTETLTREGIRLQGLLKRCLAGVEADVDFPEEDLGGDVRRETLLLLAQAREGIENLLKKYKTGKKIKSGVNVVLCGAPNAGKSSLLNALLGYERAIVSSAPGTTRDVIDGTLEIKGVLFRLTDTAGIRESRDEVEREGVRRAENVALGADLIVYLKEERDGIVLPKGVPVVTVGAKCDLVRGRECDAEVSSVTGEGLDRLKELLYERGFGRESDGALIEERHARALSSALEEIGYAEEGARGSAPTELFAENLRRAYRALGQISGETASEEVVSEIFSKFCVGK